MKEKKHTNTLKTFASYNVLSLDNEKGMVTLRLLKHLKYKLKNHNFKSTKD